MEKKILIPRSVGGKLHAIHYISEEQSFSESDDKHPFVIMCHGFSGDKYEWGRYPEMAKALNKENFDALIFDFSGSGQNDREFITLTKQVRDLKDVYKWSKEKGYIWIAIIGLSFGGLTTLVTPLPEVKTIVFWAPGFHIKNLFTENFMKSLKKKPLKIPSGNLEPIMINESFVEDIKNYDIEHYLQNLQVPILIIQGKKDKIVKPIETEEAFRILPQDKNNKLILVENATHNFNGEYLEEFITKTIDWLKIYR